jgi:hypothetical protein
VALKLSSDSLGEDSRQIPRIAEANLGLGGMDVDIDMGWRDSDLEHDGRVAPLGHDAAVGL